MITDDLTPWKRIRALVLAGIAIVASIGVAMLLLSRVQAHPPSRHPVKVRPGNSSNAGSSACQEPTPSPCSASAMRPKVHLYNASDLPSTVTPRYVAAPPSNLVICGDSFFIPAGGVRSVSMDELPSLFSQGMAYWNVAGSVVAVTSTTSDAPLGAIDRHFGYRPYHAAGGSTHFPDTCSSIRKVFLPLVTKT